MGCQFSGFLFFTGTVHDQGGTIRWFFHLVPELPSLQGAVRVAGEEPEGDRSSGLRGHQRKLGVPAAPGLADALGTVLSQRLQRSRGPHWNAPDCPPSSASQ